MSACRRSRSFGSGRGSPDPPQPRGMGRTPLPSQNQRSLVGGGRTPCTKIFVQQKAEFFWDSKKTPEVRRHTFFFEKLAVTTKTKIFIFPWLNACRRRRIFLVPGGEDSPLVGNGLGIHTICADLENSFLVDIIHREPFQDL